MTKPSKAVFLSYASQDTEIARRICDALRAAGVEVWFDQSELRGGDSWDHKIRKQIHDCALFVPIVSQQTQSRAEGYFRLEWRLADERTHLMGRSRAFIVPVCVDDTQEADADVPDSFLAVQWVRLPGGETPASFCQRVIALLTGTEKPTPSLAREKYEPSVVPPRRWTLWIAIAAGAALFAGAFALKPWRLMTPTQVVAPTMSVPEKSIAVLPFVDLSEKHDQEYFSDGLAEELLDLLAQVPELRVPARTSSFYYKNKQVTIAEIAKALSVAHVLEGSVRKAGNTLRVTVQLVRADNGYHLWSKTYDRDIKDIFKVQDDIAASVVAALKIQLLPTQQARNTYRPSNPEAYRQYLLGRELYSRVSTEDGVRAVEAFDRALALDPNYAAAYVARVEAEAFVETNSGKPRSIGKYMEDIDKALALDPNLPEAYYNRAMARLFVYNWSAAEADLRKAMALNPADAVAQRRYGYFLATQGRFAAAVAAIKKVLAIDPLAEFSWFYLGYVLAAEGKYPAAREALQRSLELSPSYQRSLRTLAVVDLFEGHARDAAATCQKMKLEARRWACEALAEQALGHAAASQQALAQLLKTGTPDSAFEAAGVYAMQGDTDRAFEWLDNAYERHSQDLASIKAEATLVSLRTDRRYAALLRKMNLGE